MRLRKHVWALFLAVSAVGLVSRAFATDNDSDGLDDAFETAIGTYTNNPDSDGDNLSDFDEVFVYGTDPMLADTDGDGTDDDTDPEPLQAYGAVSGTSTADGLPVNTTIPAAWSGASAVEGHGVYVHSGMFEYVTSAGYVNDMTGPWQFWLRYSSHDLRNGANGTGWMSMLDQRVDVIGYDVAMLMYDGVVRTWTWSSGGGVFLPPYGVTGDLTGDGGIYKWKRPDGSETNFDTSEDGRVTSILDRYGNGLTISHDGSHAPDYITDARGQAHALDWYSTGRLKTITYADGRVWTFEYDDDDNLIRILGPATTGFPSGITEEFRYIHGAGVSALNHNMIQRIDGRGTASLKMQYDTSDRVTLQTIGAHDYEFDYTNAGSYETTVFDGAGNERVWTWDSGTLCKTQLEQMSNRDVRSGDPTSWDTTWGYDADGYQTSVTLPRGNGIKTTLNAVKRVTERRHKQDMSAGDNNTNDIVHTFTYENASKFYALATYTDPEGNTTTNTNNADGRPTTITYETVTHLDPDQTITNTYTYNGDGTVATATDGESKVISSSYYSTGTHKGLLETRTVDYGTLDLATTYDYNDFGEVVSATDPNGNETTYAVNAYGKPTEIDSPSALGYETKFIYDGNMNPTNRLVKRVDEDGNPLTSPTYWTTQTTFDSNNRALDVTEPITFTTSRTTSYEYCPCGAVAAVERSGVRTEYTYDERSLLYETKRDPSGENIVTKRTYDDNGNLTLYEDGRSNDTTSTYDLFDRRTQVTNALGHYTQTVYDKDGDVTETKAYADASPDVLMAHQKRYYDEVHRLWKIEDLLKGTIDTWPAREFEHDKRGLVVSTIDRRGNGTSFTWDGAGRLSTRTDAVGSVSTFGYDDNGNVTSIDEAEVVPGSSAQTFRTEFTYDVINRRLTQKMIDRNNSSNWKVTSWEYDSLNVPVVLTDPKGFETTSSHDGLRRVTQTSQALASGAIVTQWQFDVHDKVTLLTDDNGSETAYAFDDLNRLEAKTYEDTETVSYAYDDEDNVTGITDQNGTVIVQGWDELNRLTGRSVTLATGVEGDDTESFEYDALNRLTEAQDDDSTVQFTYNSLSQMLTEVQGANPLSTEAKTVTYTPDLEGNVTDVEYPSSFEAVRTIDDDGRVSAIEDGSSNDIVSWSFYGAGHRTKSTMFGNTTTATYSWDGFRRPTSISHKDSSPTEFAGFSYGWDKNDNPTFEKRSHDSNMGDVYTYDQANRLTQVKVDVANPVAEVITPGSQVYDHKVDWTLDDVHNFTSVATTPYGSGASSVSYTVNAMNEYTAIDSTSRTFDANGNLTDDGTNEYVYDFKNHLIEVIDGTYSTTIATYTYDALGRGRRTSKVVSSDTTRFIYAGQHVIEEYDGSDDLLRLFVYGEGWDHIVMMEAPDVADVDGDTNTTELKRFWYHRQLKGDVTHVTDEDEVVVESYEYTPYGETTIKDIGGSTVSVSQIGNPFMYTGRRLDEETGLYHYRARAYDPASGRFLQEDPLGYVDGPNARAYVNLRPTGGRDPTGTKGNIPPLLSIRTRGGSANRVDGYSGWFTFAGGDPKKGGAKYIKQSLTVSATFYYKDKPTCSGSTTWIEYFKMDSKGEASHENHKFDADDSAKDYGCDDDICGYRLVYTGEVERGTFKTEKGAGEEYEPADPKLERNKKGPKALKFWFSSITSGDGSAEAVPNNGYLTDKHDDNWVPDDGEPKLFYTYTVWLYWCTGGQQGGNFPVPPATPGGQPDTNPTTEDGGFAPSTPITPSEENPFGRTPTHTGHTGGIGRGSTSD